MLPISLEIPVNNNTALTFVGSFAFPGFRVNTGENGIFCGYIILRKSILNSASLCFWPISLRGGRRSR